MTRDLSWLRTLPGKPTIVAEVKLMSPYGWVNPLTPRDALDRCLDVGDVISVHTDALWGGSFEWLRIVREQTKKPILAKGFHSTIKHVEMALDAGADYVLTVGWWPGDKRCWYEPDHCLGAIDHPAPTVVLNSRDPRTGQTRHPHFWPTPYRETGRTLCQASNIRSAADVHPWADAILIGEGLYTP